MPIGHGHVCSASRTHHSASDNSLPQPHNYTEGVLLAGANNAFEVLN